MNQINRLRRYTDSPFSRQYVGDGDFIFLNDSYV